MGRFSTHPSHPAPRRDWGKLAARGLCLVFGLLGALPLLAGFLIRTDWAQHWAARETARLFRDQIGVDATYEVRLTLVPFELALQNLSIASNDGGGPALAAERISVAPRLFSLLSGRLDVGEVELYRPRVRLVVADGELVNVAVNVQGASPDVTADTERLPFRALSLTDATIDLRVDGAALYSSALDMDVFSQSDASVEVALRVGETAVAWPAPVAHGDTLGPPPAWDPDVLCQVDARARISRDKIFIRRLSALGELDVDPTPGTLPDCRVVDETPPGRVAFKTEGLQFDRTTDERPFAAAGTILVRVPLQVLDRFNPVAPAWTGWVGLSGSVEWHEGNRLPDFSGKLRAGPVWWGPHRIVDMVDGPLEVVGDRVLSPELATGYASGKVRITDIQLEPFEPGAPLRAGRVQIDDVPFTQLMRDTAVTPDAQVDFTIDDTVVDNFHGTIFPLVLDGDLRAFADGFKIYDTSYRDPATERVFGINSRASVVGRFGVRDTGLHFDNETVTFGKSRLKASVRVGFANWIELEQPEGELDLSDVTPLVTLPMAGVATLSTKMGGPRDDPLLSGTLAIQDLELHGFKIGNVEPVAVRFRPLKIDLDEVTIVKGRSRFVLPRARFDFESDPDLLVEASLRTESADLREFLSMWNLDQDPRWTDLSGKVSVDGNLKFVIGGKEDLCKSGRLRASGAVRLSTFSMFGEGFDTGDAEVLLDWFDTPASHRGMTLSVPSLYARKGTGTVVGSVDIRQGAKLYANILGSAIPLARIDTLGELGHLMSGTASFGAQLGGTLDAMEATLSAQSVPVMIGRSRMAGSTISAQLVPLPVVPSAGQERTACGELASQPFDAAVFEADVPTGEYRIDGELFGGAISLRSLRLSNARRKTLQGDVVVEQLDLAPVLQMSAALAGSSSLPVGRVSGRMHIEKWPLDNASAADATWDIDELKMSWNGFAAVLLGSPHIALAGGAVRSDGLAMQLVSPDGYSTVFDADGSVSNIGARRDLDVRLRLRPVQLARFEALFDSENHLAGTLAGSLKLTGPLDQVVQEGGFSIRGGEFGPRDGAWALTDANVDIALEGGALTVARAQAAVGGGTVSATGSAPLRGLALGPLRGEIKLKGANLPVSPGITVVVDADLEGQWAPSVDDTAALPTIKGRVDLREFEYARPVSMNADISALAGKGKTTQFEHYDPSLDRVNFDFVVNSSRPLRINNNLLEAKLSIDRPGLRLKGTNQRYGVRGRVQVEPGGRIHFRRNEFDVLSGEVRFDDATDVTPRVDLRAVTEYRRFSSTTATGSATTATQTASGASTVGSAAGQWRIAMHAHGDTDELKLDLSSQPELSQDDIFLLLTLGLTRAELDQANLQGSVALEALGSLTGADAVVKDAIPVIDEFRFGSSYSARTGRSEPTVTVGKRLTERIRAYVTSGLTESREVRSNLEWRLNSRTSVEGSYDNINDISSSNVGNIGADVRWRIEF